MVCSLYPHKENTTQALFSWYVLYIHIKKTPCKLCSHGMFFISTLRKHHASFVLMVCSLYPHKENTMQALFSWYVLYIHIKKTPRKLCSHGMFFISIFFLFFISVIHSFAEEDKSLFPSQIKKEKESQGEVKFFYMEENLFGLLFQRNKQKKL